MTYTIDTQACGCKPWALYAGGDLIDTGVDPCDNHYREEAIHEAAMDIIYAWSYNTVILPSQIEQKQYALAGYVGSTFPTAEVKSESFVPSCTCNWIAGWYSTLSDPTPRYREHASNCPAEPPF